MRSGRPRAAVGCHGEPGYGRWRLAAVEAGSWCVVNIRGLGGADRAAISTEKAGWILLAIVVVGGVYAGLHDEINIVVARVAEEMGKIMEAGS